MAVVFWGGSLVAGGRTIQYGLATMGEGAAVLSVHAGTNSDVRGRRPEYTAAASEEIMEAIDSNRAIAATLAQVQFWSLLSGAGAFVAWHILEMYRRTDVLSISFT